MASDFRAAGGGRPGKARCRCRPGRRTFCEKLLYLEQTCMPSNPPRQHTVYELASAYIDASRDDRRRDERVPGVDEHRALLAPVEAVPLPRVQPRLIAEPQHIHVQHAPRRAPRAAAGIAVARTNAHTACPSAPEGEVHGGVRLVSTSALGSSGASLREDDACTLTVWCWRGAAG